MKQNFSKAFVGSRQYSSLEDILLSRFYCLFAALCLLKIVFSKRNEKWFLWFHESLQIKDISSGSVTETNCFTNHHQLEVRKTSFILYRHRSLLKAFFSHSSPGRQADYANMADLTQLLSPRTEKQAQEKAALMLPCSVSQGPLLCFLTSFSTPSKHPLSQVFVVLPGLKDKTNWITKCLLINIMGLLKNDCWKKCFCMLIQN